VLGVGAYLAIHQEITPGVIVAASIIMGRAVAPVEMAVGQWRSFVNARSAFDRLKTLLEATPVEQERTILPPPKGFVRVENIVALPPGTTKATLQGVTFELDPGEALGIVGPSAAGKSTLARNLVGVWPPLAGAV